MLYVLFNLFGRHTSHNGIVCYIFQHYGSKTGKASAAYRDLLFDANVGRQIA